MVFYINNDISTFLSCSFRIGINVPTFIKSNQHKQNKSPPTTKLQLLLLMVVGS